MKEINLDTFQKVTKDEWLVLAENQLKDKEALKTLDWQSDQSIQMEPYYDSSDLEGLEYISDFFKNVKPFRWKLYEEITVNEESEANRKALEALAGGCDGVVFVVGKKPRKEVLFKSILTNICDISLITKKDGISGTYSPSKTGFVIFSDRSNAIMSDLSSGSQVNQIVEIIKSLKHESYILRHSDSDFFLEIASIRALRYLLSDFLEKDPWACHIHTSVSLHQKADHQWFLNTTAGLASILGGSNSIQFNTASGNSRISRNVGNLIREESGIEEYYDQCGGAYYLEVLTHKIIEECLKKLKN